ncbi:galactose-3-O-sulfotransferase 3-like [Penaeus vannamei]|uniref:galactose-3-O-sulfotransferase 3-like n=1 Tax=Penaeus vannamei TaxID=6689 RepID=UPI00387F7495
MRLKATEVATSNCRQSPVESSDHSCGHTVLLLQPAASQIAGKPLNRRYPLDLWGTKKDQGRRVSLRIQCISSRFRNACASTTGSQIFIAYGVKHGLKFALPTRLVVSPQRLPTGYHGSPDGRYIMVVSHTVFSKEGAQQVMNESAKYVVTIREPASRFESMWYFRHYEMKFDMNLSAFTKASQYTWAQERELNTIAYFWGVKNPSDRATESEMYSRAKGLNEIFDLVVIAERFDKSLVLLKHLMC